MSDYERNTVLSAAEVMSLAEQILAERAGLQPGKRSHHAVSFSGGEGTVMLEAHRHGPLTTVTVRTDQLRTSKVDIVVRHLLNQMPYQPSDTEREY